MPYIVQDRRDELDSRIDEISGRLEAMGWIQGDVNYTFYRILLAWWKSDSRYHTICSIMGTLSCVSQEIYRKVFAAYEDKAEEKNGKIT